MAYKDPLDPRSKEAKAKHYQANKARYMEQNRRKRLEMREWLSELKSRPCMDCGGQFPPCAMDFDHRDPSMKADSVTRILLRGSWSQLKEEVDKCDIVCANCHRIRTHLGACGV